MRRKILKTFPHLADLNNYSLKIFKCIMNKYPSWAQLAEVAEYKGEKYLEVKVSAPVNPTDRDLIITTNGGRLTIHFDYHHAHFGEWHHAPEEAFRDAIPYINGIMSEELFVVRHGNVTGMYDLEHFQKLIDRGSRLIYTRSWRGTYTKQY